MNWIIYFTSYGNCKKLAEMVSKFEPSGKQPMKIENGELISGSELSKVTKNDLPHLIYLISPVRRHSAWKKTRKWMEVLAKEIQHREKDQLPQRKDTSSAKVDPATASVPWRPQLALLFSHRFPEDQYKIDLSVKKLLHKIHISKKDKDATMADLVKIPILDVLVEKVTGPLEASAGDKIKGWIASNATVLLQGAPQQQAPESK